MSPSTRRAFQPQDLYNLKTVSDVQVSPDGASVAYVVSSNDREADEVRSAVFVAPADGTAAAKRFTYGAKDSSPRWSGDGAWLAFVSKKGEEKEQVYVAPLGGGEAHQVTQGEFGASQPAWSPDSKRIAFVAATGDYKDVKDRTPIEKAAPRVIEDLVYRFDGIGQYDERRRHLFVVDLDGGNAKQLTDGDWHDDQPAWSPDGKTLAFVSNRSSERNNQVPARRDAWIVASDGGRARRLTRGRGGASYPAFSPDGKLVAFSGHEHGDDSGRNTDLFVVEADGNGKPRSISADLDRSVVGGGAPLSRPFAWSPNGASLYFLAADRGSQGLFRTTLEGGATKVWNGDRCLDSLSLAPDGKSAAVTATAQSETSDAWTGALTAAGPTARVSNANEDWAGSVDFGKPGRMTFKAADGLEIDALLMYPPGFVASRKYPLVLLIHGGPHGDHLANFIPAVQSLAAAGYVVLLPNPRGSGSYGEEFTQACVADWGGKDFEDLMTAVDQLIAQGVADPDRLYVTGYSYGGFMTSWTIGHTDRFRAAAVGAPVADHVSMYGTTDIPMFMTWEHGGTPWSNAEHYRSDSPSTYLDKIVTPVLLYHNEGDLRCPVGQSEEMFQALKLMGKEVTYVRYPGGFHGVSTPSQLIDRMERIRGWFDAHQPAAVKAAATKRAKKARAAV